MITAFNGRSVPPLFMPDASGTVVASAVICVSFARWCFGKIKAHRMKHCLRIKAICSVHLLLIDHSSSIRFERIIFFHLFYEMEIHRDKIQQSTHGSEKIQRARRETEPLRGSQSLK